MNSDESLKYFILFIAIGVGLAAIAGFAVIAAPFLIGGYALYRIGKWYIAKEVTRKEHDEYHELYERAQQFKNAFSPYDATTIAKKVGKAIRVEHEVSGTPLPADEVLGKAAVAVYEIVRSEQFPSLPDREPSPWNKAKLNELIAYYEKVKDNYLTLIVQASIAVTNFTTSIPHREPEVGFMTLSVPFLEHTDDVRWLVGSVIEPFFDPDLAQSGMGQGIREALDRNLCRVSKVPFSQIHNTHKEFLWPSEFKGTPRECVNAYLGGTPLHQLFDFNVAYTVALNTRFEHMHICAGTGHGKTQAIQELIANDISSVMRGEASVVVIDSQGDLIKNISHLRVFEENDKLTLIDPTDIEYPPCLNLFDVNMARIKAYSPLEQEKMVNAIIELYDFVFTGLLGAELTSKQSTVFRYVLRLLLQIPEATIHTLRELFEPDGFGKYERYVERLPPTARAFFETEFQGREFSATKQQVLRRLWGVLENQTFERMFSHPKNKLDIKAEMDEGRVILINTAKDLLKQSGTEIFGRFFIAMIAQAAQERAVQSFRIPTYVYIDEAADYFDQNIELILREARKYRIGITLAHQYLGQLTPQLQQALAANTAIKLVGGVSDRDARQFAHDMRCDPSFILSQPKGHFAAYARSTTPTAMTYRAEFGFLEAMPRTNNFAATKRAMRQRYAVRWAGAPLIKEEDRVSPPSPPPGAEQQYAGGDDDDWRS